MRNNIERLGSTLLAVGLTAGAFMVSGCQEDTDQVPNITPPEARGYFEDGRYKIDADPEDPNHTRVEMYCRPTASERGFMLVRAIMNRDNPSIREPFIESMPLDPAQEIEDQQSCENGRLEDGDSFSRDSFGAQSAQ